MAWLYLCHSLSGRGDLQASTCGTGRELGEAHKTGSDLLEGRLGAELSWEGGGCV